MPDSCGCGTPTPTEAAAMRHAKTCGLQGLPGCRVTVYNRGKVKDTRQDGRGLIWPRCGEPADDTGLCVAHRADKERLS